MPLLRMLFSRDRAYVPSPTVEYRIDREPFDLDALHAVLEFVIEAIREERTRLEIASARTQDEPETELIWPDAA